MNSHIPQTLGPLAGANQGLDAVLTPLQQVLLGAGLTSVGLASLHYSKIAQGLARLGLKHVGLLATGFGLGMDLASAVGAARRGDTGEVISSGSAMGLGVLGIFYPPAAIALGAGAVAKVAIEAGTAYYIGEIECEYNAQLCEFYKDKLEAHLERAKIVGVFARRASEMFSQF